MEWVGNRACPACTSTHELDKSASLTLGPLSHSNGTQHWGGAHLLAPSLLSVWAKFCSPWPSSNRLKNTFFHQAARMLNSLTPPTHTLCFNTTTSHTSWHMGAPHSCSHAHIFSIDLKWSPCDTVYRKLESFLHLNWNKNEVIVFVMKRKGLKSEYSHWLWKSKSS